MVQKLKNRQRHKEWGARSHVYKILRSSFKKLKMKLKPQKLPARSCKSVFGLECMLPPALLYASGNMMLANVPPLPPHKTFDPFIRPARPPGLYLPHFNQISYSANFGECSSRLAQRPESSYRNLYDTLYSPIQLD